MVLVLDDPHLLWGRESVKSLDRVLKRADRIVFSGNEQCRAFYLLEAPVEMHFLRNLGIELVLVLIARHVHEHLFEARRALGKYHLAGIIIGDAAGDCGKTAIVTRQPQRPIASHTDSEGRDPRSIYFRALHKIIDYGRPCAL